MASLNEANIQNIVIQIEMSVSAKRQVLDTIKSKYETVETYNNVVRANDFAKLYGDCVDDYGKVNSIMLEISEALMDIRTVRRALRTASIPPSTEKSIRNSIEYNTEILTEFKEAVGCLKESLLARLRFYNSCQYMQFDKLFGDKC